MGRNEGLLARRVAAVTPGLPIVTQATAQSARGSIIIDDESNEIIDFAAGIGVMNAGHGQDAVIKAICEQAAKLVHTCIHITTYEPYIALCEKLTELFPHGDATKCLLLNSGAEAVENAVKIARLATGRSAIICFTGGFHGRTLLGMRLTSKTANKAGCGQPAPEIYRLPFPDHFHYGEGVAADRFVERELDRFRESLVNVVAGSDVAGVLIEPVLGEGGFVPAPEGYLRGLRRICDDQGILLIFDEVQSGFCRTGKWAAYLHFGVTPDLSTWAKSMGGGIPIAAVIGQAEVMDKVRPGTVGGTYGGNPVACAAALANIGVMEQLNLNDRAAHVGRRNVDRFRALGKRCSFVADVRGLGAMVAMELVQDGDRARPATAIVKKVLESSLQRGVLALGAGTHGNVIRVLAPLTIPDDLLDRGLTILEEEVLRHTGGHHRQLDWHGDTVPL